MKIILVILSLAASTIGRPDVSQIPSGSYLPGTGGSSGGGYSGGSSGFIGGGHLGSGGGGTFGGSFGSGQGGYSGGQIGFGGGQGGFGGGQIGFGGAQGGFGGGGFGGGIGGGGPTDQKNVYFFSAPEEGEQSRLRIFVAPSGARNTKVIFVKAPSYGSAKPEIIAPPSQTEDKTLVYVLVKKPENGGSITIPSTLTSKPSKPEVYFIKYSNQQEAEQAVSGGIQEQSVGNNVKDLGNEQSFIKTLKDDTVGGGISGGIGGISGGIGGTFGGGDISGGGIIGGGSVGGGSIGSGGKYGPPGASGPYRR